MIELGFDPFFLFFFFVLLLRAHKRPIDHRNLISLTGGPDKYHQHGHDSQEEKYALNPQETPNRDRKLPPTPTDLNEQVINLLDSFDPDQRDLSGFLASIRAAGEISKIETKVTTVDNTFSAVDMNEHQRQGTDHGLLTSPIYASQPLNPVQPAGLNSFHVDQRFTSPVRQVGGQSFSSSAPRSLNSSTRFSRPPYSHGPRW